MFNVSVQPLCTFTTPNAEVLSSIMAVEDGDGGRSTKDGGDGNKDRERASGDKERLGRDGPGCARTLGGFLS